MGEVLDFAHFSSWTKNWVISWQLMVISWTKKAGHDPSQILMKLFLIIYEARLS